ncbi:hypothetical protein HF669_09215 [Acidithiobacillus thiooxidans]|uniref:hypothetical protein n=1 Tax=Acidithiobacillus thiooxidans TaxID=930 RepID=UPI001111A6E6|nr:hypothetical protein [Acidithiobacillus thiooxidans]MBU2811540.1 hypothetical protein [Acidithiobacillus thiooxidans]
MRKGIRVNAVRQVVADFLKDYPSVAQHKPKLVIAENQEDLFHGRYPESEARPITGVCFPGRSTVGLAAASFYDQEEVRRGIRHEVQGHFALHTYAHGEKRAIVERIVQTGSYPA